MTFRTIDGAKGTAQRIIGIVPPARAARHGDQNGAIITAVNDVALVRYPEVFRQLQAVFGGRLNLSSFTLDPRSSNAGVASVAAHARAIAGAYSDRLSVIVCSDDLADNLTVEECGRLNLRNIVVVKISEQQPRFYAAPGGQYLCLDCHINHLRVVLQDFFTEMAVSKSLPTSQRIVGLRASPFYSRKASFAVREGLKSYIAEIPPGLPYYAFAWSCRERGDDIIDLDKLEELWMRFCGQEYDGRGTDAVTYIVGAHKLGSMIVESKLRAEMASLPKSGLWFFASTSDKPEALDLRAAVATWFHERSYKPHMWRIVTEAEQARTARSKLRQHIAFFPFYVFSENKGAAE